MTAVLVAAGVGGVSGAGMGYSSAQHIKDIGAEALGFTPVKNVQDRITLKSKKVLNGIKS